MSRWPLAPWWVVSVVTAAVFTVVLAATLRVGVGDSIGHSLTVGTVAGLLFGLVMGPFMADTRRRLLQDLPHATPEQRSDALRSAHLGPVPTDPRVRLLAGEIVRRRLEQAERQHTASTVGLGLFSCLYILQALTSSPWWLIAAAFFATTAVVSWGQPARLERRLDRLRGSPA